MWRDDDGSAVAEFTLVGVMVTLLFLAVLQLGIDLYARNVLASCAADGARYGANADIASPEAGAERARELAERTLGRLAAVAEVTPSVAAGAGRPVVVVRMSARLPTAFGLLPALPVHVEGRSLLEGPA